MMTGDAAYQRAKRYVKKTMAGAGAIKGDKGDPGTEGFSPSITENADNNDDVYKLDIETKDGTFTTPNLKGQGGDGEPTEAEVFVVDAEYIPAPDPAMSSYKFTPSYDEIIEALNEGKMALLKRVVEITDEDTGEVIGEETLCYSLSNFDGNSIVFSRSTADYDNEEITVNTFTIHGEDYAEISGFTINTEMFQEKLNGNSGELLYFNENGYISGIANQMPLFITGSVSDDTVTVNTTFRKIRPYVYSDKRQIILDIYYKGRTTWCPLMLFGDEAVFIGHTFDNKLLKVILNSDDTATLEVVEMTNATTNDAYIANCELVSETNGMVEIVSYDGNFYDMKEAYNEGRRIELRANINREIYVCKPANVGDTYIVFNTTNAFSNVNITIKASGIGTVTFENLKADDELDASSTNAIQNKAVAEKFIEIEDILNDFETQVGGKSAYEIWLDEGNTGTEEDFLNSLKGTDGKSAYGIWFDAGNTGTETEFLATLKGNTGETGPQGLQGPQGIQGPQGPQGEKVTRVTKATKEFREYREQMEQMAQRRQSKQQQEAISTLLAHHQSQQVQVEQQQPLHSTI